MRVLAALLLCAGVARADDCHSQLMIVLDRSCSMNMPPKAGGAQTKWELAGLALQTMTTKYQGQLDFGLIMFPDQTGMDCLQDGPIYVNVAPGQEATVVMEVMSTMPTGPCVTNIKPAIDQVSKDPAFATVFAGGTRHFVLFISDGKQTCGGGDSQIAASVKALFDQGYPTYVVGFGDGVDPAALDLFAVNGGVPRPSPGDMGGHLYYQADDAQTLNDALDHIIGSVAGEFVNCPGIPCPDGRCFNNGPCTAGFCLPSPGPTTGSNGGSNGGSGGDGGSSSGGGRAASGCGCDLGGAPGSSLLLLLLAPLWWARRRFSR